MTPAMVEVDDPWSDDTADISDYTSNPWSSGGGSSTTHSSRSQPASSNNKSSSSSWFSTSSSSKQTSNSYSTSTSSPSLFASSSSSSSTSSPSSSSSSSWTSSFIPSRRNTSSTFSQPKISTANGRLPARTSSLPTPPPASPPQSPPTQSLSPSASSSSNTDNIAYFTTNHWGSSSSSSSTSSSSLSTTTYPSPPSSIHSSPIPSTGTLQSDTQLRRKASQQQLFGGEGNGGGTKIRGLTKRQSTRNLRVVVGEDPEKDALVSQIAQLQETLRPLVRRVESAKHAFNQQEAENQILRKYIANLMKATNSMKETGGSGGGGGWR
ncbi:hypothetical protein HK102_003475 [Quaeritorhiza haematococci]|nr:hypothetical protein HK102_003475 [Quaeritorhiza haematococci]